MFFKRHLTVSRAREIFEEIESQVYPDITDLKRLVNFHKEPIGTDEELQALDLKYRAMTHIPTTIEKTMTPYQLYQANNPLWARELSALGIESFLDLEDTMEYNLDLSEGIYTELRGGTYKLSKEMFDNTYEYALNQMNPRTVDFASYYPKMMMEPTIMAQPKITIRP